MSTLFSRLDPRVWMELAHLNRTSAVPSTAAPPEILLIGSGEIVWRVPLSGGGGVYMIARAPHYGQKFVTHVHTGAFYREWRRQSLLRPDAQGCPRLERMGEDYKYHHAERGFLQGRSNPVPLADVGFMRGLSFVDGITRTMWLIRNGAQSFPVATGCEDSCRRLARTLGASTPVIRMSGN